jgi:hypothetical protein
MSEEAGREEIQSRAHAPEPVRPMTKDELAKWIGPETAELLGMNPDELFEKIKKELDARTHQPRPQRSMNLACSFCDRGQREVKKLIAGPQVCVCDSCVGDGMALLARSGWVRPT